MAFIEIWRNYEIVNGVKVFGKYKRVEHRETANPFPISDFDAAKHDLWDAYDEFRKDFNYPTQSGIIYDFSPSEMDLERHDESLWGCLEGFEYDDSVTMWSATISEKTM